MKTKLLTLKKNAWHYKLIKILFGRIVGDPSKFTNFCPYGWLLVLGVIISPIALPIVGIRRLIDNWYNSIIDKIADNLDPVIAIELLPYNYWNWCDIAGEGVQDFDTYKTNKFKKKNWGKILNRWAEKNNIPSDQIYDHLKKYKSERQKYISNLINEEDIRSRKKMEAINKERDRLKKISNILLPITNSLGKIRSFFTIKDTSQLIKIAKRISGVFITLLIAFIAYFFLSLIVSAIVFISINWESASIGIYGILSAFILVCLICGIYKLSIYTVNNVKLPTWIYHISLGFYYPVKYTIWYPGYFLFYCFIWKLVCVSILWGILKGFWKGFVKSTGVFGEYLSKDYGDTCPGIEWKD